MEKLQCKILSQTQITQQSQHCFKTVDSPMQIRLINFLGLRQYLINKLIFKRKATSYKIRTKKSTTTLFNPRQYSPPLRYECQTCILQYQTHSIPIVKLTPFTFTTQMDTIIYAHGNSSDMSDALKYVERIATKYIAQYVVFDYTGYGESKMENVGEELVKKDLQVVIAYLNKSLSKIVLWGFSLGSYPVVYTAAKYPVKAIILQCPIGSVACFFADKLDAEVKFKQDYFANIDLISQVKGKIFLIHSAADQIIPINQAQLLFDRYVAVNDTKNITFIQVMALPHNGIHKYIISYKSNDLQSQVFGFLKNIKNDVSLQQKQINQQLVGILKNIKLSKIQEQVYQQEAYQIVADGAETSVKRQSPIKLNCFCFPLQLPIDCIRQKFKN